ncbi:pimeloyl-ACP methyl ester carboxylesterase [Microbacterium sp. W4I4]|uniref:alpha/beta fold hydrolase n=1 Tax=Microbacterium sp. W4I4 TaxID=3042295 RepID=UPI00278B18A8|nr:alpha/beta hydrolase [Microbacterium sp. W4I4]MDQ0613229.1 pimeloyl-ACP methyl ester carboxylesterase [Microbacterium sp. W4I4]
MAVAQDTSEFRYLPAQAQRFGIPVPSARRIALALPDGRSLSALHFGDGAPEVTLLHGAGLNAHTWDSVALLLGRPALMIDLAGHGDSSWRADLDYSPAALAGDVVAAIEEWTDEPQVLIGHSLGGLTATVVAARHPELVAELILVDIVPGLDTDAAPAVLREFYQVTEFDSRDDVVARAEKFGFGGAREDTERGVFFNTRVREDGRIEWKHHFAQIIGHAFDALNAAKRASTAADLWSDITGVTAPLTLVRGSHGFLQDADVAEFSRQVPSATVTTVDAGHNIQETDPASLASLAADALSRTSR